MYNRFGIFNVKLCVEYLVRIILTSNNSILVSHYSVSTHPHPASIDGLLIFASDIVNRHEKIEGSAFGEVHAYFCILTKFTTLTSNREITRGWHFLLWRWFCNLHIKATTKGFFVVFNPNKRNLAYKLVKIILATKTNLAAVWGGGT